MVTARGGRAHPWHDVPIGDDAPRRMTAYVEIAAHRDALIAGSGD